MERNAHYAAVGLATVTLMVALAVFVVWLARFSFNEEYDVYDVLFTDPVRGLSVGGEVHFNGIRVGEVTDLTLDRETGNQVIARIRLDEGIPVRTDSRAQLEPLGITGVNYIQITSGTPGGPLLKDQFPAGVTPVIQSQRSPVAELLQGSGTLLAQAVDSLNRINRVLSDENIRSFASSLENVETLTAEMEARRQIFADLEEAVANANAAILEYQGLGQDLRQIVQGDGAAAIANIERAAAEAEAAARDVRTMTDQLQGPVGEFADQGLPQLADTISELEEATETLNDLIADVNRSPREFIQRPPSEEMEIEQ
ncbi:MlaD family protein [Brevundimonas aveniformis]|uniref:MlaD family protein n=1 Tax=Brevundimonas aveniformis TaxID=370977 RepID=UPI0024911593|nr:MlaD family protein [Brevundimonas aveniformis]